MHVIDTAPWNTAQFEEVLRFAEDIEKQPERYEHALSGRNVVALFDMPSTRMRVSVEVASHRVGAHVTFVAGETTHLGSATAKAALAEEVACLSRLGDVLVLRLGSHADMESATRFAACPVVSARSNRCHPVQAIADLATIRRRFGRTSGLVAAYVGPPNAVCNSLIDGFTKVGIRLLLMRETIGRADEHCRANAEGTGLLETVDGMAVAVERADIVFLGTGALMGSTIEERSTGTETMRLTRRNLDAHPRLHLMHSMPASDEVEPEALYHERSLVFEQVRAKVPVIAAFLLYVLHGRVPDVSDLERGSAGGTGLFNANN
ncbi:MAG: hypothetical protein WB783_13370 [Arenicellales bacterium]